MEGPTRIIPWLPGYNLTLIGMKKVTLIPLLLVVMVSGACTLLSSSDAGRSFEYRFETERTEYTLADTVNATFTNQSDQTLLLSYRFCTIAGMQQLKNGKWNSVTIPIVCTAEVKEPVTVGPGGRYQTGIILSVFEQDDFEAGTYRLDVLAREQEGEQQRELPSNTFEIIK